MKDNTLYLGHIRDAIDDMRNILIHDYSGVNTKAVWDTCKKNLPELKQFVTDILD